VIYGKPPFYQVSKDAAVAGKIGKGEKPARPGKDGQAGNEIDDAIWSIFLSCWAYEVKDRPTASKILQDMSHIQIGERPLEERPAFDVNLKASLDDFELTKAFLAKVLGSQQSSSVQIPQQLQEILSRFVRDSRTREKAEAGVMKLTRDETQVLVDFLELVSV